MANLIKKLINRILSRLTQVCMRCNHVNSQEIKKLNKPDRKIIFA